MQEFASYLSTSCFQIQSPREHGYTLNNSTGWRSVVSRCAVTGLTLQNRHLSLPWTRHHITTCSPTLILSLFGLTMSASRLRRNVNYYLIILDSSIAHSASPAWRYISGPQRGCLISEPRATRMLTAGLSGRKTIVKQSLTVTRAHMQAHSRWHAVKKKKKKQCMLKCTCQYTSTWVSQLLLDSGPFIGILIGREGFLVHAPQERTSSL